MTPLEQIKKGISLNDMDMINAGYAAMTNEPEPVIEHEPYVSEELVESDDPFHVQIRGEHKQNTRELEDGTIEKEAKRQAVDLSKIGSFNMFEDDGETSAEYKDEDREFDKKAAAKTKVGRRTEVKKVAAKCVDCGKNFKVLPIHQLEGSFTCSKCIKGKRRR